MTLNLKMVARSLSANRLGIRTIQNGGQIKFILKIAEIFVEIFHSLPSLRYCLLIGNMILSLKLISRTLVRDFIEVFTFLSI